MSPEASVGTGCCRTHARKMQQLIGPLTVRPLTVSGAVKPGTRKAFDERCCFPASERASSLTQVPRWEQPHVRVMLVFANVSSMNNDVLRIDVVLVSFAVPMLLSNVFAFLFGSNQCLFCRASPKVRQASTSVCGDNVASCSDSSFT